MRTVTILVSGWRAVVLLLALASPAAALVNPSLQPNQLYDRYRTILVGSVEEIDSQSGKVSIRVAKVVKGTFSPKLVTLAMPVAEAAQERPELKPGDTLVAFVSFGDRRPKGVYFYYGDHTQWQSGQLLDVADPARWEWSGSASDKENANMQGIFNGSAERLAEMVEDLAADRYYFPALSTDAFRKDLVIAKFAKPLKGVALYDIDGDGQLDIYACSEAGNRVFLQTGALTFTDATDRLGLGGIASASCSFADVRGNGRADLLVDGRIYLAGKDVKSDGYAKSELLPSKADEQVLSSAFVDINGDGYPDVVISKKQGGLHCSRNPGAAGGPFVDVTRELGLDTTPCGADGNGHFAPGDWTGNGRMALWYSVRGGLLLLQDADGRFSPAKHPLRCNFETDSESDTGQTGAACFAPLWRPEAFDLFIPQESTTFVLTNRRGTAVDVTAAGNEINDTAYRMFISLTEDLNADGTVDVYTISSSELQANSLYMNRGYGSYMRVEKYRTDVFPGLANTKGAGGAAAGDVDGDGANDILLGGLDGTLTLLINDVLVKRKPTEHPTAMQRKLLDTHILTVHVTGNKGVQGAVVRLTAPDGRTLGLRQIGAGVYTGCASPTTVNLAVREPGPALLTVRYSDGKNFQWPVDLRKDKRLVLEANREKATPIEDSHLKGR